MGNEMNRRRSRAALAALLLLAATPAVAGEPTNGGPLVLWYGEHPLGPIDFTVGDAVPDEPRERAARRTPEDSDAALSERRTALADGWQATTHGRDIRWAEVGEAKAYVGAGLGTARQPDRARAIGLAEAPDAATGLAGQARTGLALPLGDGAEATTEFSRTYAGGVDALTGDGAGPVQPRNDQILIGTRLKF